MTPRRSGRRSEGWEGFFVNGVDRWRGFNLKLAVICPLFLQGQIGQSGGNNLDSTPLDSACEFLAQYFPTSGQGRAAPGGSALCSPCVNKLTVLGGVLEEVRREQTQ